MAKQVQVKAGSRSWDGQFRDMKSYWVVASDGKESVEFEVRLTLGNLEMLDKPEDKIRDYYSTAPLPKNKSVVDLNL